MLQAIKQLEEYQKTIGKISDTFLQEEIRYRCSLAIQTLQNKQLSDSAKHIIIRAIYNVSTQDQPAFTNILQKFLGSSKPESAITAKMNDNDGYEARIFKNIFSALMNQNIDFLNTESEKIAAFFKHTNFLLDLLSYENNLESDEAKKIIHNIGLGLTTSTTRPNLTVFNPPKTNPIFARPDSPQPKSPLQRSSSSSSSIMRDFFITKASDSVRSIKDFLPSLEIPKSPSPNASASFSTKNSKQELNLEELTEQWTGLLAYVEELEKSMPPTKGQNISTPKLNLEDTQAQIKNELSKIKEKNGIAKTLEILKCFLSYSEKRDEIWLEWEKIYDVKETDNPYREFLALYWSQEREVKNLAYEAISEEISQLEASLKTEEETQAQLLEDSKTILKQSLGELENLDLEKTIINLQVLFTPTLDKEDKQQPLRQQEQENFKAYQPLFNVLFHENKEVQIMAQRCISRFLGNLKEKQKQEQLLVPKKKLLGTFLRAMRDEFESEELISKLKILLANPQNFEETRDYHGIPALLLNANENVRIMARSYISQYITTLSQPEAAQQTQPQTAVAFLSNNNTSHPSSPARSFNQN